MSGRVQSDGPLSIPRGNKLKYKWLAKPAEGYPDGMYAINDPCKKGQRKFIATYVDKNEQQVVRSWNESMDVNAENHKNFKILVKVTSDSHICWNKLTENGSLPPGRIRVAVHDDYGSIYVGKISNSSVGIVAYYEGKWQFKKYSEDNNESFVCEDFLVLCSK